LIAVIADTHLPKGNRELPEECIRLEAALLRDGGFRARGPG
jgi:hypothetical protein